MEGLPIPGDYRQHSARSQRCNRLRALAAGLTALAFSLTAPEPSLGNGNDRLYRSAQAIEVMQSGKILVAGADWVCNRHGQGCDARKIFVRRYTKRGKPNRNFGQRGRRVLAARGGFPQVTGLALHRRKILLVGTFKAGGDAPTIIRLTRRGRKDGTFGSNGTAVLEMTDFVPAGRGRGIAVDSVGRILVAGRFAGDSAGDQVGALRLLSNGSLDTSFGDGGIAHMRVDEADSSEFGEAVSVDREGRIVVSGITIAPFARAFAIARFLSTGQPDPSFNGRGATSAARVTGDNVGGNAPALELDKRRRVLVSGSRQSGSRPCGALVSARLLPSGGLDSMFGRSGIASTSGPGCEGGTDSTRLPGGKFVVVGGKGDGVLGAAGRLVAVRYRKRGNRDRRFARNGVKALRIQGLAGGANAVDHAQRRSLIVVGFSQPAGCRKRYVCQASTIVRLKRSGRIDRTFGRNGAIVSPRVKKR